MIIGQYCDSYPPGVDGVSMVVKSYVEELNKVGDTCYYVSAKNPTFHGKFDFETLLYRGFKVARKEPYYVGLPNLDIPFQRKVKDVPFDIAHGHSPFSMGAEARRIAKRRDIPLIGTFHSKFYDDFYDKTHSKTLAAVGTKFVVNFYNHCDEVWTVNESTAKVLQDYGYRGEIIIMPNGTDLWYPTEADRNLASEELNLGQEPVFLFVGQHNWKKNIRHIIDAVKLYSDKEPCKLVMVGQGASYDEIAQYAKEQGLESTVIMLGHVMDRARLMRLYARADLFLFPSLYDTAGLVIQEAAAAGTPSVVVEGACAADKIEDGVNGFLCENTPQSLMDAMVRGLDAKETAGAAARETLPVKWSEVIARARARYEQLR